MIGRISLLNRKLVEMLICTHTGSIGTPKHEESKAQIFKLADNPDIPEFHFMIIWTDLTKNLKVLTDSALEKIAKQLEDRLK